MMELTFQQKQSLRYAMWRGRRYLPGGGYTLDVDGLVESVTEVLTPIVVLEVCTRVGFDEAHLDELWSQVETHTAVRVRRWIEWARAEAEAQGFPIGDDADAVERALAASLGLHSVNEDQSCDA